MKNNFLKLACACSLLGIPLTSSPARAEGILDLNPYVSGSATHDDNVFRVSGRQEALALLGEEKMSDVITVLNAGINASLELGRQFFRLELGGSQVRYDHFTFQDYNGRNDKLAWDWRIGNHLSGELATSRVLSQSGFTEFQSTLLNERTVRRDVFAVNWEVHPRWQVSASHEEASQENSELQFRSSDRDETSDEVSLTYRTPKDSEIRLSLRRLDTEYPGRLPSDVLLYGDSNQHREVVLKGRWQPGGKVLLNAQIASFAREGEGPLGKDFKDVNSRLDATWQATGKTALSASVWQEFRLADDLNIGFSRARGIRVSPVWRPTSKIQVQADAMMEDVTYLEGDRPDETMKTWSLNMTYLPHEKVRAQLGWQHEARETPDALSAYRSGSLNASVRIDF
jgi:exopolysaccharide biosynthesis operon protein EpsL